MSEIKESIFKNGLEKTLVQFTYEQKNNNINELINKLIPLFDGYTKDQIEHAFKLSIIYLNERYVIKI